MRLSRVAASVLPAVCISIAACSSGSDDPPTVTEAPVAASVHLTPTDVPRMTAIGETRTLVVAVRDASGALVAAAPVAYASTNPAVATITGTSTSATITATGNGTATLRATSGSASAQLTVTVEQQFDRITLDVASLVMGANVQLTPVARDSRNVPIANVTGFVISGSTPSVAYVHSNGVVTAIEPGVATIHASLTLGGITKSATSTLTVSMPQVPATIVAATGLGLNAFNPKNVIVDRGGLVTFTFETLPHNITFQGSGSPPDVPPSSSTAVQRTFANVGTFPYSCTVHAAESGTITVVQNVFFASMKGTSVVPSSGNPAATGGAWFRRVNSAISYVITFQGLSGAPTAVTVRGPASASETGGILAEINTSGIVMSTGGLSGIITAADITGPNGQGMTVDELITLVASGNAYIEVRTQQFGGGEIRGQIRIP